MRHVIALAALLLAAPAFAQTSTTLSWQNPATYDDGSALDPADIVSHRVEWTGSCPGFSFVAPQNNLVAQGNAESMAVSNITPGVRCFRVFVTARDPRCTLEPCVLESLASALWEKTFADEPEPEPEPVPASRPMAPTWLGGN